MRLRDEVNDVLDPRGEPVPGFPRWVTLNEYTFQEDRIWLA
jgi:hypothetical protein